MPDAFQVVVIIMFVVYAVGLGVKLWLWRKDGDGA